MEPFFERVGSVTSNEQIMSSHKWNYKKSPFVTVYSVLIEPMIEGSQPSLYVIQPLWSLK